MTPLSAPSSQKTRSTNRRARLHPPLTDIPIGAIVIAATLDLISSIRGGTGSLSHDLYRAGTFSLMVGTAVMVLTITAGFVDRARFTERGRRERTVANLHATVMCVLAALCVADIVVRRHTYPHAHHTPGGVLTMTLACAIVLIVGGTLGGKLVYAFGVGVSGSGGSRDQSLADSDQR